MHPDTSNPIYLLPLKNKEKGDEKQRYRKKLSFWFVLPHLLVRSSSTKREIQVHDTKLKTKNHKKIQKRDSNLTRNKTIRQRYRPKERDEHPDQYQQQHLQNIAVLPHSSIDNQFPIKRYFFSFIQRSDSLSIYQYPPVETRYSCLDNSPGRHQYIAHKRCIGQDKP